GSRARSAQPPLRPAAAARAGLLRSPADGPADVASHRRPAGGAVLPGLRADLHRPVAADHWARRNRDVPAPPRACGAGTGAGAVRGAGRTVLWKAVSSGAA